MSMSPSATYASTSSASSYTSSSDDDDDSHGTGSFSSSSSGTASFSSQSTIVAPIPPSIQPFGKPEYNYFWIENKSKSNPRLSYFYNCKSHSVVWNRPISKNILLPTYTSAWTPLERINPTESDNNFIVSDEENNLQKKKRLQVKKRNRQLLIGDKDESVKAILTNKTIKSKKSLEIFWKLFRLPGESVAEIKKRLLNYSENDIQIKTEVLSDEECNKQDVVSTNEVKIKEEPLSDNDHEDTVQILEAKEKINKLGEDSDSDPENVSAIIKQEYMTNYDFEDSELENENQESEEEIEDSEEEKDSEESLADESELEPEPVENCDNNIRNYDNILRVSTITKRKSIENGHLKTKLDNLENENDDDSNVNDDEEPYLPIDTYCSIEIVESDNQDSVMQLHDLLKKNDESQKINWTFEKTFDPINVSPLTRLALNPMYKISKMKRKKKQKKEVPKTPNTSLSVINIKKEPADNNEEDGPIICDMYGTRTINYNHPEKMNLPSWYDHSSKLSDDSDDSLVEPKKIPTPKKLFVYQVETPNNENKNSRMLELKSWFPKKKRARISAKNSDSSWRDSESSCSDDSDMQNDSMKDNWLIKRKEIKSEIKSPTTDVDVAEDDKFTGHTSGEKVIKNEESEKEISVNTQQKKANDVCTLDSESSSASSCSCSRSSCSCNSSSDGASDAEDNDNDKDKDDNE